MLQIWRPLALPLFLLVFWATLGAAGAGNPNLLVPPLAVLKAGIESIASGALPGAVGATLARTLAGWSIGVVFGLALGILLGQSRLAGRLIDPTIDSTRQIALFAWIPLLSAWLGNGEGLKITLIALGALFPIVLATEAGCRGVPAPYLEIGRVLELDRRTQLRRIVLPAAAPSILSGLELSLNIAWLGTIGAEYLIGTGYINGMGDGIGAYLASAREYARMDQVLIGVVTLALTGLALDRSVVFLFRKALPWHMPTH
jgi:sulfonate transport system permease protein